MQGVDNYKICLWSTPSLGNNNVDLGHTLLHILSTFRSEINRTCGNYYYRATSYIWKTNLSCHCRGCRSMASLYEKKILLLPADVRGPVTVASYGRIRLFHLEWWWRGETRLDWAGQDTELPGIKSFRNLPLSTLHTGLSTTASARWSGWGGRRHPPGWLRWP